MRAEVRASEQQTPRPRGLTKVEKKTQPKWTKRKDTIENCINHIMSEERKAANSYCRFLPVSLNGVHMAALVDSGNVWHSVISKDCYLRLGLSLRDLRKVDTGTVSTAKKGAFLNVLGEPVKSIKLSIGEGTTHYSFRPVVVDGLTMDVNLSGPWMKAHGWDQLHTKDCLAVQGRKYMLRKKDYFQSVVAPLYFAEDTPVPANSFTVVRLRAPEVKRGLVKAGQGYLRGETGFMDDTDLHPALNALVECDEQGEVTAAVLNTLDEEIVVKRGQRYGTFTTSCKLEDWSESSDSICFLDVDECTVKSVGGDQSVAAVGKPPTRKSKMDDYIKAFVEKAKTEAEAKRRTKTTPGLEKKKGAKSFTEGEKRQWLISQFELDKSPFLQTPGDLNKAVALLMEFWDLFSHDGSFGKTHLITHRIITEDVPPIKCRYRPINPALEDSLKEQIQDWLDHDVIEPSESPWSFNIVAAKKRGGAIRWCIDWRRLNDITKKDSFPMPSVTDNIARLAGSKVFSGIDLRGAFHCIDLDPKDREKTAFAAPSGLYQMKRLGFGLTNGPATYCRLVERILRDIPSSVAIGFLDDGVIHSRDLESHFDNLKLTLAAYMRAGVKLSPKKCAFFKPSIIYLGHVLDEHGTRPTDSYIDAVKKWPVPKFRTEARAFIGVCNYYRSHIKDFALIAKPWTDVMGSGDRELEKKPLEVTADMECAFETLKHRLTTAPVLGFPYFKGPKAGKFILDTDFCKDQISGILSQMQQGKEVVIAYGSKKLQKSQRNWPSTKGELYAGMAFMKKYAYYLQYGKPFTWRTDNSALKYVRTMDCPSGIVERWLTTLADFPFEVEHRAGKAHTNADGLSRYGYAVEESETGVDAICDISDKEDRPGLARQKNLLSVSGDELKSLQVADEDLRLVRIWLEQKVNPDKLTVRSLSSTGKIYAGLLNDLFIGKDGIIRYKCPNQDTAQVKALVCVPKKLWRDVIRLAHLTGGHMAAEATTKRLRRSLYFPSISSAVSDYVSTCLACQAKTRPLPDQRHTLVSPVTGYPFARIHLDFVGPLTPSRASQARYLLTVKDAFSKWVEAFPMRTPSTANVIKVLERDVFARYGIPEAIHSDCGSQFTATLFKDVGELLGYQVTNTGGYNPKGNGQVERFHRDLGAILRALVRDDPASWEAYLPQALFAIRTAVNRSTGLAPFQIMFGRDVSQPLDLIFGNPNNTTEVIDTNNDGQIAAYLRNLRERIDKTQAFARQNLAAAVRRQRRQYHQEKKSFLPGTKVWLFTPTAKPGASRKLSCYWTGPWTVCNTPINEVMVRIAPHPSWTTIKATKCVSIDRLKVYRDGQPQEPEEGADLLMEGDEFAENVVLHRRTTDRQDGAAHGFAGGGGGGAPLVQQQPPLRIPADVQLPDQPPPRMPRVMPLHHQPLHADADRHDRMDRQQRIQERIQGIPGYANWRRERPAQRERPHRIEEETEPLAQEDVEMGGDADDTLVEDAPGNRFEQQQQQEEAEQQLLERSQRRRERPDWFGDRVVLPSSSSSSSSDFHGYRTAGEQETDQEDIVDFSSPSFTQRQDRHSYS